jgi:CubicO group peptidase (beta-lactamase class C family)
VVEVTSGQGFAAYVAEHITRPLEMSETSFAVPASKKARVAPNNIFMDDVTGPLLRKAPGCCGAPL